MTTLAGRPHWGSVGLLLLWILAGWGISARSYAEVVVFSGPTMGTRYLVRVVSPPASDTATEDLQQQVQRLLDHINARMSTYDPQSELSRFNQSTSTAWFEVSSATAQVVTYALQVAERTAGALDPTVGPAVDAWGFGPAERPQNLPTEEQISALRERIGYQNVAVRLDPPAIRKAKSDIRLDLSAIAKGFAVDQVFELLVAQGFDALMVEIGGEVRTAGTKPGGEPWRIAIEKPRPQGAVPFEQILQLRDAALATSGDYRNFYERDGQRYSHTINPRTARPVQHRLLEVSVQAVSCMEADALATALLVMGEQQGYTWCVQQDVAALLQVDVDGQLVARATPAFQRLHPAPADSKPFPWQTFLLAAVLFALAIAGMAIGVIVSNRRLPGSCGGLANMRDSQGNTICEACTTPSPTCSGHEDQ